MLPYMDFPWAGSEWISRLVIACFFRINGQREQDEGNAKGGFVHNRIFYKQAV